MTEPTKTTEKTVVHVVLDLSTEEIEMDYYCLYMMTGEIVDKLYNACYLKRLGDLTEIALKRVRALQEEITEENRLEMEELNKKLKGHD